MRVKYARLWKRLLAYLLDIIPISLVVFGVAYFFLGFDRVLSDYFHNNQDIELRKTFLSARNLIRETTLLLWIFYGLLMDCSKYQGTHGKILLRLKVVDDQGGRITFSQSLKRAYMKIIGAIPLGLGYFCTIWRKDKLTWHDLAAKTRVIHRT
ncbi:RDD family protein [Gloeothece verrucosa]|nr:RDD family protein [Gloeothece verrucosa]